MDIKTNLFPYQMGYRMPAEWEEHQATWTSWPFDDELWFGLLENVRAEMAQLIATISQFEPVHLLVRDEEARSSAQKYLQHNKNIIFHNVPLDDIWFRDNGPIFIRNNDNRLSFVKWQFDSWGKKFKWDLDNLAPYQVAEYLRIPYFEAGIVMEGGSLEVNGKGVALTTKQCLLSEMRNPNVTQEDIESALLKYLGIEKLLWLEDGLEGDHTDGHIDTIVRFASENTIVCSFTEDVSDKNHKTMKHNYELLQSFTDTDGKPFQIVLLPLPKNKMTLDGERLACTYANFYIGNGFVVVPQYEDPYDEIALAALKKIFPQRKVIGLKSKYLICGGGSFHCSTQQQPVGEILK